MTKQEILRIWKLSKGSDITKMLLDFWSLKENKNEKIQKQDNLIQDAKNIFNV